MVIASRDCTYLDIRRIKVKKIGVNCMLLYIQPWICAHEEVQNRRCLLRWCSSQAGLPSRRQSHPCSLFELGPASFLCFDVILAAGQAKCPPYQSHLVPTCESWLMGRAGMHCAVIWWYVHIQGLHWKANKELYRNSQYTLIYWDLPLQMMV